MMVNYAKLFGKMGWGPDEADQRAAIPGARDGVGRDPSWGLKERHSQ